MRNFIPGLSSLKLFGLLLLISVAFCRRTDAQAVDFRASVTPASVPTNGLITYTFALTNQTEFNQNVFITNRISSLVQTASILTNNPSTLYFFVTNGSVRWLVFNVPTLGAITYNPTLITLNVFATNAVSLTNTVTFFVSSTEESFTTNLVTSVTNVPPNQTDLAVSINGPAFPVLVNDYLTYRVNVTNLGPNTATDVFLTNTLPNGVNFRNSSASNGPVINVGSMTNLAVRSFLLSVQPTNSGTNLAFSARVSTSLSDTNTANNFFSTNITVLDFETNGLLATNLSAMVFNPQNSLMEQSIRLVNVGTNTVDSARVIVTGLTNWLRNAVGTNFGNPYVTYGAPLEPGQSVDLLLQYFIPKRLPITVSNDQYIAAAMPAVSFAAPTNYTFAITNQFQLPSKAFVIEFGAITGRTYTILYSEDFSTNTLAAQPSIVAQSSTVQWIDDGPPKTISHPSNAPVRFYRVLLNP